MDPQTPSVRKPRYIVVCMVITILSLVFAVLGLFGLALWKVRQNTPAHVGESAFSPRQVSESALFSPSVRTDLVRLTETGALPTLRPDPKRRG